MSISKARQLSILQAEIKVSKDALAREMFENTVDVVGLFDPTPVSDLVSAALALSRGDVVGASASLISTVPGVGDALGKPFKAARSAASIRRHAERIAALQQQVDKVRRSSKAADNAASAITKADKAPKKRACATEVCKPTKSRRARLDDAAGALGYEKTNFRSHGQPVYRKGNRYITPDVDSHNGGVWKMADSPEALRSKATRMGTYDADLKRIGD